MPLFEINEPTTPEIQNLANGVLKFGNQIAETLVRLHRQSKEMVWKRSTKEDGSPFTLADAQELIDDMGSNAPVVFQRSANLATFINANFPGVLDESELASPVPYTVEPGRVPQPIVLDPTVEYPGPDTPAGVDGGAA